MVSIGSTSLPGVQTNIESASSTGVNVGAAAQVGLVGQADLTNGTANANQVYAVRTPVKARTLFGAGSMLAEAVVDALTEGAYPVYAAAPVETAETGEDLSGLASTSGSFANAPVIEDASKVSFTIDSQEKTAVLTYEDPSTKSPGSDEVYFNPVTGAFELDAAPSSTGSVDYTHYDYEAATDALIGDRGERIDLVGVLSENTDAVDYAHSVAVEAVSRYEFMFVVAGASPHLADPSSFTNSYDSSRIQLLYPSRNSDDQTIIGAYLGLRAALGINSSPIFKRLQSQTDLAVTLSKDEQESLLAEKVVPVADESRGARLVEDVMCVVDDNTAESAMAQGLHRLIVDYVTEVVNASAEEFIGELHTASARNSLRSIITNELSKMLDLNSLQAFTITVEPVDAMTASVDVGIDTADPLRNIIATISAGDVTAASA